MSKIIEDATLPSPEPAVTTDTAEFWDAAAEGRLLIGRCHACGEAIWFPRPKCPFCHSMDTGWEEVEGHGTIYSFTVVRKGIGAFAKIPPYVLAYVQLDEGPRIMTNIVDAELEAVEVGQAVEVCFQRTPEGRALPRFRPVTPA